MIERIGFMQGRLSPLVQGKIQAFPVDHWREEMFLASKNNLACMEWTLDYEELHLNPIMTNSGQLSISQLQKQTDLNIISLTGDLFMQEPFWQNVGKKKEKLIDCFKMVCNQCASAKVPFVVVPLVDNGRLRDKEEERVLLEFLIDWSAHSQPEGLTVLFESDYGPKALSCFLSKLPADKFGINYDTGNSASLGFNPEEEFAYYGNRILNVHIKDRLYNGPTVPLGEGAADLAKQIKLLEDIGYDGCYILQTARAQDNDHLKAILLYRDIVLKLIRDATNNENCAR
jgi:L-ribulose-5-phosphate 3-epimerase